MRPVTPGFLRNSPGIKTQVLLLGWTTPTLASGGGPGAGKFEKMRHSCAIFFGSLANPQMTSRSSHCRAAEARFFATSESLRPAISARAVSRPRPRRGDRLFPGREARVERPSGPGGSGARDGRGRARVARPRPVRRLEGQGARGAQSAFRARVRGSPRAFRATAPTPPRARRPPPRSSPRSSRRVSRPVSTAPRVRASSASLAVPRRLRVDHALLHVTALPDSTERS